MNNKTDQDKLPSAELLRIEGNLLVKAAEMLDLLRYRSEMRCQDDFSGELNLNAVVTRILKKTDI